MAFFFLSKSPDFTILAALKHNFKKKKNQSGPNELAQPKLD